MFLATTALGPILYHLWIYNGSANANYFFAINLVFGTAQIFLVRIETLTRQRISQRTAD